MNNKLSKDITLLIPTKNRTKFLNRVLKYYSKINFSGIIAIGDSSTGEDLDNNRKLIESNKNSINLIYKNYPNKGLCQTSHELLKDVTTKFVAEVHDDNFVIPDSINQCIAFLNNNPDYSAARGLGISIKTKNDVPHGKLIKCVKKQQPSSENETASERLQDLYGDYSDIHYAVHRTEIYREVLRNSHIGDNNFFHIMTTAITFILGKVKKLDTLHVVRHIQSPMGRKVFLENQPESVDVYNWISGKDWNDKLMVFQNSIVSDLMKIDGISDEKAKKVYESSVMMFLSIFFDHQTTYFTPINNTKQRSFFYKHYGMKLIYLWDQIGNDKLMKGIKYLYPRLRLFFVKLRYRIFGGEVLKNNMLNKFTNILLPSLLNKRSKYHKNFMPIYNLITNPTEK